MASKKFLDEYDVDEILDTARALIDGLTDGQKCRLREGKAYVAHINARHVRALLDTLEPPGDE